VATKPVRVTTSPLISSVSFFDSIGNLPRMAKLIWRPHDSPDVKAYILERQTVERPDWVEIAVINNRLHAEYIDRGLDDNRVYRYRLRALTYDNIRSTPSEVAKVITKPLPNEVQNLQATTTLPKRITLSWDPSTEKDHSFYNIYRSDSGKDPFDYYVKLHEPNFTDVIKEDGKHYYYKVTSTDVDGLEGLQQSVPTHGNTLEKPKTPTLLNAFVKNGTAVLTWKSNDPRTKTYKVVKKTKTGWINWSAQEITGITKDSYAIRNLQPDTEYKFEVIAVDRNNISSEPTKAAEILFSTPNR
jgi:fibronectin type 3 domain-containing protein